MKFYQNKFCFSCAVISSAAILVGTVLACGPNFPNSFLSGDGQPLLVAPRADFDHEIDMMSLPRVSVSAVLPTNSYFEQTLSAELSDLRSALTQNGTPSPGTVLEKYEQARMLLRDQIEARERVANFVPIYGEETPKPSPAILNEKIIVPENLPGEFADYLRGLIAYHQGQTNLAQKAWQHLLDRPATERHFRTVWATYMMGRSTPATSEQAIEYFQKVRALVKEGLPDTIGLAAASIGWEARAHWKQGHLNKAIDLYVQQLASGDYSARNSLHTVAAQALQSDDVDLEALAKNPTAQRVITAYLISRNIPRWEESSPVVGNNWLEAVERAGVKDVTSAERLALVAYQSGKLEVCARWLKRAGNSPTARWLKAKIYLHAGNLDEAANLIAQITPYFPVEESTNSPAQLEENLHGDNWITGGQQIYGELGALRLSRGEYTQALDALLKADFWTDAAYVAERVLTIEELKQYVDGHFPISASAEENETTPAQKLRYLLARRLTRNSRGGEAGNYFPTNYVGQFQALSTVLPRCYDESLSAKERADAFWSAAQIVRTNGMELLGTEGAPDWAEYGGSYELESFYSNRLQHVATDAAPASKNELKRGAESATDPDLRFHYRYIAADLAWEAANLLPNNTDEKALILCRAGTWLKYVNPEAADRFYKALVRRCRKTAIGAEADRLRWFPELDDKGNILPRPMRSAVQSPVIDAATDVVKLPAQQQ